MNGNACAIIVSSCDAYSDAWMPFFTLFFKYWPDCPYPVYLVSNGKKYPDPRVRPIIIAEDKGWAGNLKYALSQVPSSHVLYFQEDYFLKRAVCTERVASLFETMTGASAAYLRLTPSPNPKQPWKKDSSLGVILPADAYRTSLQAAFWDKSVLDSLFIDGESGAAFEDAGSRRSSAIGKPFLSVRAGMLFPYNASAPLDYLITGIIKRKWNRDVVSLFKKEGIAADFSKRPFESEHNRIQRKLTTLPLVGPAFKPFYRVAYRLQSLVQRLRSRQ